MTHVADALLGDGRVGGGIGENDGMHANCVGQNLIAIRPTYLNFA